MKKLIGIAIISIFFLGCCGLSTPSGGSSSGSCSLGTYGSACTNICTLTNGGDNCFSTCMDEVRNQGLGDATTCCKQTFRQACTKTCTDLSQRTQGDTTVEECMEECTAVHDSVGIDLDSCALPI